MGRHEIPSLATSVEIAGAVSAYAKKVKNNNLASLASYGVTAAKLTALKTKIEAYAASIAKPREAVASGSTATKQLDAEFHAADAALNDELDALVPQFKSANATFVNDYRNARIIVDLVGAKAKAKTPKPPGP